ncbi:hypothetical protein WNY78_16855 [Psychroserpens sp. AS72]|uniref:hypothetical protein n=1 Tax=Psychroserpens sp. AS72 TaxID=3135775 RepID=UPI00317FEA74
MRQLIFVFIALLSIECNAQFKNYKIEGNKVKVVKMYSDITTLEIKQKVLTSKVNIFETKDLTTFLVDKVAKIPDYITQYLKKRKKKFSATYDARNALQQSSDTYEIESLVFKRNVFLKNKSKATNAMTLELVPEFVQNKKFIVFKISKLDFNYSKAIVKPKAPFLNLLIEIKAFYAKAGDNNTITKTEIASSSLIVPVDLRESSQDENLKLIKNQFSDVFLPNGITEISVKVTEINPYKLKLEELETFISDNNEDFSGLFEELSKILKN